MLHAHGLLENKRRKKKKKKESGRIARWRVTQELDILLYVDYSSESGGYMNLKLNKIIKRSVLTKRL